MEEKRCIYKGNSGEKRIGTRVKKGFSSISKFKIQKRGVARFAARFHPKSPEIRMKGLAWTEKKLPMGRVDLVCAAAAVWLLLQCSGN
ncbi:hypothetical protein H5410_064888 [Solanum commersonii]|uniref:Uncharacterized protein n=1 Tax=Solanum commersonii TaxID=4109 RepID=A0A9J5VYE6_SOLCO|nr:hypothetical protein H5410_064888 [Solanum commersonii]